MVMIINKKRLDDGAIIYVLGCVSPAMLHTELNKLDYSLHRSLDHMIHVAMKKLVKKYKPELHEWLVQNKACTTFWVDHQILTGPNSYSGEICDWGIGFLPKDPLELVFALRWS